MATTWRKLIEEEMLKHKDSWKNVTTTLSSAELDEEFDDYYGSTEGKPFTLWTYDRVYFPVEYDGAEWVGSVPRHPCDEATDHVGG